MLYLFNDDYLKNDVTYWFIFIYILSKAFQLRLTKF